ncbi:hypothetical protein [Thiothrix sp.]|uniref:hypothetical protein n=1 Tax=Thiothrix sp. TaxID=1032 RepID=UPI0025806198|nr:hypothetical protein [Thiothrix sp.]
MLRSASNVGGLGQYLLYSLAVLVPTYLLTYVLYRLKVSASVLESYEAQYLLFHAFFLLLALIASRTVMFRGQWWHVILLGMVAGILAACCALPAATAFSLDDGLERLISGYQLVGISQLVASYLLFSIYSAAWLLGTVVFVGVFWLVIPRIRG